MTHHSTAYAALPTPSTTRPPTFGPGGLTAGDAERIAAAIDAELADSTRTSYAPRGGSGTPGAAGAASPRCLRPQKS